MRRVFATSYPTNGHLLSKLFPHSSACSLELPKQTQRMAFGRARAISDLSVAVCKVRKQDWYLGESTPLNGYLVCHGVVLKLLQKNGFQ